MRRITVTELFLSERQELDFLRGQTIGPNEEAVVGFTLKVGVSIDRAVVLAQRTREEFDADPDAIGEQRRANETNHR